MNKLKYILFLGLFLSVNFSFFSQNERLTNPLPCQNPILGTSCLPSGDLIMNGSGSLGLTYDMTACGLNYVQTSLMTTTRFVPPGSGFPASLTVSGIPNCATILKAYVWYGASSPTSNTGFTFNGTPYTSILIGTGIDKCWSLGGTQNYRGDVTASVTGNGTFTFSSSIGSNGVDGVTLMVIFSDPNATYQGTIRINDGAIVSNSGGASAQTMTGLSVCATSSFGNAFLIVSDMQDNVPPPFHNSTLNGVIASFPNQFWNFDVTNTTFTGGQTTSAFGTVPASGSDCYDWVMMGVY